MAFCYDLLRLRPVRVLVRWGGFPYVFQALMLAVFVGLAWLSWGVKAPEGAPDKLFAKNHLVQLRIWGLWWPAIVWTAVLLGRAKVASWGGFLPGALADPAGAATAAAITSGVQAAPVPLLAMPWVALIGVAGIAAAAILGLREARFADRGRGGRLALPILLVAASFAAVVAGWAVGRLP